MSKIIHPPLLSKPDEMRLWLLAIKLMKDAGYESCAISEFQEFTNQALQSEEFNRPPEPKKKRKRKDPDPDAIKARHIRMKHRRFRGISTATMVKRWWWYDYDMNGDKIR